MPAPRAAPQRVCTWFAGAAGIGVVPWALDRVSTRCETPYGTGSSWKNLPFFDFEGASLPVGRAPRSAIEASVVTNPGFEVGDARAWSVEGEATIDWETTHSGWAALRLDSAHATIRQTVEVQRGRTDRRSAAGRRSCTGRVVVGV